MAKVVSESERLFRRIRREFEKRKFIGDIPISDEEYVILLKIFPIKFMHMLANKYLEFIDPVLAVTLVQIGIRMYDGNYWKHVKGILRYPKFSAQHQAQIGMSFLQTLKKYNKVRLSDRERINSVLMHGFVSDYYADRFFDFLFAFYQIDLDRDLSRLDHDTMNILIEVMCRSDNTGRTYNLVEQTADAVRSSTISAKTRIRRYLKLIDKAFWDEDLPESSTSRIVTRLIEWTKRSSKFVSVQAAYTRGTAGRTRSYASPYITCNFKEATFDLVFPRQTINFENEGFETLQWDVDAEVTKGEVDVAIDEEGVTGYRTEEIAIELSKEDLFSDIVLQLKADEKVLRRFKIKKEKVRFFDDQGRLIASENLGSGMAFSYSSIDFVPTGRGVSYSETANGLTFTVYDLEIGDLILLPDGKPISVGNDIREGLQNRGDIQGLSAEDGDTTAPVYSHVPQIVFKAVETRLPGTALILDEKIFRLEDLASKTDCLIDFDLNDRSGERGYLLDCSKLDILQNGMHEIRIDIPNDHSVRRWKFVLIDGFSYSFEGAPYIFQSRGSLVFPLGYCFDVIDGGKIEKEEDGYVYNFDIIPGLPEIKLGYQENVIHFDVPALSYKFEGEDWKIAPHKDIWHGDFEPKLCLDYDKDKVWFYMDDSSDEGEEHVQEFTRNKKTGLFECDLNRFKSWFGRDQIIKTVYLKLPDVKEPIPFLRIVTQSYLVSSLLTDDLNKDLIEGKFEIVGKADYYADLLLEGKVVQEKIPLENGSFSVQMRLDTGLYKAVVYEAEEDDSGFGETMFYEIGETEELDLINPMDLNGKSIAVDALTPARNSETYYPIKYQYHIVDLSNQETKSRHDYLGKMIVLGTFGDKLFATFPVNVNFYDLDELRNTYITFIDEGDQMDFLYDESDKKIVKQEDSRLCKREAYRRYKFSEPEELIYRVSFYNPSQEELSLFMDDGEYNNLVCKKKEISVFKEKNKGIILLEDMGLSTRSYNALYQAGFKHAGEVFQAYIDGALFRVRDFGRKDYLEVEGKLRAIGYPIDDVKQS